MSLATVEEVRQALAGEGYLADRGLATAVFLAADARAAAAARGRGRGGQDGGRARAGRRDGRAPDPAAVPRGHRPPPRRLRLGLPAPAAGDPRRRGRRRRRASCSASEFLLRRPLLEALEADGAGRAADRRGRPRRRRVRGVPARVPGRLRRSRSPSWGRSPRAQRPLVVLTSNRTRELHDALKRRCLYHWIDYPTPRARGRDRARAAARRARARSLARVCAAVARLRGEELYKLPGVGETITWARALLALGDGATSTRRWASRSRCARTSTACAGEGGARRCLRRGWPRSSHRAARRRRGCAVARRARRGRRGARRARAALAAVDAGVARGRRTARCAPALCSPRARTWPPSTVAFAAVFGARRRPTAPPPRTSDAARRRRCRAGGPARAPPRPAERRGRRDPVPAAWSDEELLRDKDFAAYTDAERAVARRLLRRSRAAGRSAARAARARPAAARARARPARDRCARRCATAASCSSAAGGAAPGGPARSCWCATSRARWRPTRGCCCSTMQAAVAARSRVEAFAFGTRLTRITRELAGRDPDAALAARPRGVVGLAGGTRIGDALGELNRGPRPRGSAAARWSCPVRTAGTAATPRSSRAEMARLRRTAHRSSGSTRSAADPRYEPLTRGMAAATAARGPPAGRQLARLARAAGGPDGGGRA